MRSADEGIRVGCEPVATLNYETFVDPLRHLLASGRLFEEEWERYQEVPC